jgi:hypothetical protein
MAEILARLDRTTGLRVMCGSIGGTCRGEFARIAVVKGRRMLCMLDGFKQNAGPGHFAASDRSLHREAKATAAVRKGTLDRDVLASRRRPQLRRPIPAEKDANRAAYGLTRDNYALEWISPAGILADCPVCGRTNTLRGPQLGVAQR